MLMKKEMKTIWPVPRHSNVMAFTDFSKKSTVLFLYGDRVWEPEMNFLYVLRYKDSENDI